MKYKDSNTTLSSCLIELNKVQKKQDLSKYLFYTAFCSMGTQLIINKPNTFCLTVPIALASSMLGYFIHKKLKIINDEVFDACVKIDSVQEELLLLGYDIDEYALYDSTIYNDGLIYFYDQEGNQYNLYEEADDKKTNYYLLMDDDVEKCLTNPNLNIDISKRINEIMHVKHKQNMK